MNTDPLATFVELLERNLPDIARRMRPAPEARVAALAAIAPPLPPEYRRFLELAGGNLRGELAPFMPEDAFDVDHAIASYSTDYPRPPNWVFFYQRFEYDLPSWVHYLAPVTSDAPPDPAGSYRVAMGYVDEAAVIHDIAHNGSLEERLLEWLFLLHYPTVRQGVVKFDRQPEDECEAGDYFVDAVEDIGFRTIAGGRDDFYQLLAHDDDTWIWLSQTPADLARLGRYAASVRAPSNERRSEVSRYIKIELDGE